MADDARSKLYSEFLQHAVESSLQAVDEARSNSCDQGMSHQARERVTAILLDSFAELQRIRTIGTLDASTAQRVFDEISEGGITQQQRTELQQECRSAILAAFANFAESLAAFVSEIEQERQRP